MADPKTKTDRSLIEGGENHQVRELAVATGLSFDQADALVEKYGDDPKKLEAAAAKMADPEKRPEGE